MHLDVKQRPWVFAGLYLGGALSATVATRCSGGRSPQHGEILVGGRS